MTVAGAKSAQQCWQRPEILNDETSLVHSHEYISKYNLFAAIEMRDAIEMRVKALKTFPAGWKIGRVAGTREMVLAGTSILPSMKLAMVQSQSCASSTRPGIGRRNNLFVCTAGYFPNAPVCR